MTEPQQPSAPGGLVCPRCGAPAIGTAYCGTCGLHLADQEELPTRERWEREDVAPRRVAAWSARWSEWWSERPARSRIALILGVLGALVVVSAVVFVVAGGSDSSPNDRASDPLTTDVEGPPPEQRCVDLWNSGGAFKGLTGHAAEVGEVVAEVGFSADFPDRCLITVAMPDEATSAYQYRESTDAATGLGPYRQVVSGSVSELPESAKQWNARINTEGTMTLGYP